MVDTEDDGPIEENFRKDVSVMCNLSQGIKWLESSLQVPKRFGGFLLPV